MYFQSLHGIYGNEQTWKWVNKKQPQQLLLSVPLLSQHMLHKEWPKKLRNQYYWFSSVQSLSCVWLFVTPWTAACWASLVDHQLLEPTQTHVHRVSDAIQPSHPLSSPSPPAPNPSQHQGLFQGVGSSHQVAKYWSFSFSISPSIEYSGLISFRIDWFDLLAVQGTLKSLIPHHSSKASILQRSAFFIVQLPHPYMTTGKTIALTKWTFIGKVSNVSAF